MRNGVSCLALGILLVTATLNANGQTRLPTFLAQAPVTVPSSGVLVTPPLTPSAVPPSGVLAQPEPLGRPVTTVPIKMVQPLRNAERAAPATMRRPVVHRRTAARHEAPRSSTREEVLQRVTTTRTTTVSQRIVSPPVVLATVSAAPAYFSGTRRYYNFVGPPTLITPAPAQSPGRRRPKRAVSTAPPVVATPRMPAYRYVYEADRILVVDPYTNLAVQAIPR